MGVGVPIQISALEILHLRQLVHHASESPGEVELLMGWSWDGCHPTPWKYKGSYWNSNVVVSCCFILSNFDKSICWCGKCLKNSCDLSLPLRCCVVSWKRAATKARLSRLLMYTERYDRCPASSTKSAGTRELHVMKENILLWELTRSFQTAFCTGSNYS